MAFLHSTAARVVGNGRNLGAFAKSFTSEGTRVTGDGTVIDSTGREITMGHASGNYKAEGFLNVDTNDTSAWEMIQDGFGGSGILIAAPCGETVGYPAIGIAAGMTNAAVMPSVGDTVGFSVEGDTTNGFEPGIVLQAWQAKTATFNGTSVDAGAASTGGAAAFVSVGAFTGTNVTLKIQHSTDNLAWGDAATFTSITAGNGGERIEIAPGTLNRYRRVAITGGTFTSIELMVALAAK